jgi:hypothetical protein
MYPQVTLNSGRGVCVAGMGCSVQVIVCQDMRRALLQPQAHLLLLTLSLLEAVTLPEQQPPAVPHQDCCGQGGCATPGTTLARHQAPAQQRRRYNNHGGVSTTIRHRRLVKSPSGNPYCLALLRLRWRRNTWRHTGSSPGACTEKKAPREADIKQQRVVR